MFKNQLRYQLVHILADRTLLAPGGQVVIAGYPQLIADPVDWPSYDTSLQDCNGISLLDVPMLRQGDDDLDTAIRNDVREIDPRGLRLHYVDVNNSPKKSFLDHGLCSRDGDWINNLSHFVPDVDDVFHPNRDGYTYYAKRVTAMILTLKLTPFHPTTEPTATTTTTALGLCGLVQVGQACIPADSLGQSTTTTSVAQIPTSTTSPSTTLSTLAPGTTTTTSSLPAFMVDVGATTGWDDTPILILQGQPFTISYVSGSWSVDYRNFPNVGPEGYSPSVDATIYQDCKFNDEEPYGTLLGAVADQMFVIGNGGTFVADTDGSLQLRINDADQCLGDNAGSILVSVTGDVSEP